MGKENIYKVQKTLDAKLPSFRQKIDSFHSENLSTVDENIEIVEELSATNKKTLVIRGVALTEGKKKNIFYPAEELKKAAHRLIGQGVYYNFQDKALTHKPTHGNLVGQISNAHYDDEIKGIRYEATITRPEVIDLILKQDKSIGGVSVGVGSFTKMINNAKRGFNILFKEMSLIRNPADKNTTVEVNA